MTLKITTEMLADKMEPELLEMAMGVYMVAHPRENPRKAFSAICGCAVGTIVKALNNSGHLGGDSWLKIERALGVQIYREWLRGRVVR